MDLKLALECVDRRLAVLLFPAPNACARRNGDSQSGKGPEIAGRPSGVDATGVPDRLGRVDRPRVFFGAALEGGGEAEDAEADPKSHLREKKPERPLAFFGGGGDMHELGSCSSSS